MDSNSSSSLHENMHRKLYLLEIFLCCRTRQAIIPFVLSLNEWSVFEKIGISFCGVLNVVKIGNEYSLQRWKDERKTFCIH